MRVHQVGPGSSKSTWKATLDPGKNLPCSNSPNQHVPENDNKSSQGAGASGQQTIQQTGTEQKK